MKRDTKPDDPTLVLAKAVKASLISPNVADSNLEPANVVDVLNYCANGLHRIADALERIANVQEDSGDGR